MASVNSSCDHPPPLKAPAEHLHAFLVSGGKGGGGGGGKANLEQSRV